MGEFVTFVLVIIAGVFVLSFIVALAAAGLDALRKWLTGKMR